MTNDNLIKLQSTIQAFLQQNDDTVSDVKLILSQKNYESLIKLFQHILPEKQQTKLRTSKMFSYKKAVKDTLSGASTIVECTIDVNDGIKLIAQKVFTEQDIATAMATNINNKHQTRDKLAETGSVQGQRMRAVKNGTDIKTTNIELAVPISDSKYTDPDKEFYSWWVRDENDNIYLKTKDKKLVLLPLKENGEGKISGNNDFWTLFWKNYREKFVEWEGKIRNIGWNIYESIENEAKYYETQNVAVECHKFVPKFFLQCLSLCITQIKEEEQINELDKNGNPVTRFEEHWKTSDISPKIKIGKGENSQTTTINESSMKSIFIERMAEFDKSEITKMKRFSNTIDPDRPAFFTIQKELWEGRDLSCVDANGNPAMPKPWIDFLVNKFKIDKSEQLYRLASFMMSIVDADNYSRQVLVIAGEGNDGKSTFINVLTQFFNDYTGSNNSSSGRFVEACSAEGMMPANLQNGLVKCLDSRLITIGDVIKVSELINTDAFKQITGLDTITCPKKYCDPITKNMAGVKLLIATNEKVYMTNDFATTRVIPMYFSPRSKDEPDFDIVELRNNLVKTMPQFLKWCHYYNTSIKAKYKIANNHTKIFKFDNSKTEKACYESLYSKEQKFFYNTKDEYANIDDGYFEEFVSKYIKFGENYKIDKNTLLDYWEKFSSEEKLEKTYTMTPKSPDLRNLFKYIKKVAAEQGITVDTCFPTTYEGRSKRVIKGLRCQNNYLSVPAFDEGDGEPVDLPI